MRIIDWFLQTDTWPYLLAIVLFLMWLAIDYGIATDRVKKFNNRGLGSDENYQSGRNLNGKD